MRFLLCNQELEKLLPKYSYASDLTRPDIKNLSLAVSLALLEATAGLDSVIKILTIICSLDFEFRLFLT